MRVVAAAVVRDGSLLLVSKQSAPTMFYLPGGKPEPDEAPLDCLRREVLEELSVEVKTASLLGEVADVAANEGVPMRMTVFLADLEGEPLPASEIAAIAWLDGAQPFAGQIAPAVRNGVLPALRAAGLLV